LNGTLKHGCDSDNDSTDIADTLHYFDGTLRIAARDMSKKEEPEDSSGSALAGQVAPLDSDTRIAFQQLLANDL